MSTRLLALLYLALGNLAAACPGLGPNSESVHASSQCPGCLMRPQRLPPVIALITRPSATWEATGLSQGKLRTGLQVPGLQETDSGKARTSQSWETAAVSNASTLVKYLGAGEVGGLTQGHQRNCRAGAQPRHPPRGQLPSGCRVLRCSSHQARDICGPGLRVSSHGVPPAPNPRNRWPGRGSTGCRPAMTSNSQAGFPVLEIPGKASSGELRNCYKGLCNFPLRAGCRFSRVLQALEGFVPTEGRLQGGLSPQSKQQQHLHSDRH